MRARLLLLMAVVCLAGCGGGQSAARPSFHEAAAETGLRFHHFNGATGAYYMPEIVGPGAALFDFDNDGDLDVYLVQGWFVHSDGKLEQAKFPPPAGWKPGNRLFRNELVPSGKLRFTDVTESSGAGHAGQGMGVAAGDIDNDGYPDLYVTNYGGNVMLRNQGGGRFTDVTAESGTAWHGWTTSAAFIDYDRDGDLDLFAAEYVNFTLATHRQCRNPTGAPEYCGPQVFTHRPSHLWENMGGGRFRDVSAAAGIRAKPGPGLGVAIADFDVDGWPDVYVANDGAANHLWRNQRDGTFREAGLEMGAAYAETGQPRAGMGVSAADMDGDRRPDVIVTNLTNEGSTLFGHAGEAGFFDTSAKAGLASPTALFTGFGVGWFDYDNDGWLDLYMANGAVRNTQNIQGPYPYQQRNLLFHNEGGDGGGRQMRDTGTEAGEVMAIEEVSRAAVFGDIDNDGDIDVLVTNNNGPVRLLLNETRTENHWLLVKTPPGACVEIDGDRLLRRCAQPAYSYLASNDPRVHLGLGAGPAPAKMRVLSPDGSGKEVAVAGMDRIITVGR